jgi:hypothetical protein
VEDHPDGELLRAGARETMLAIAYTIGCSADRATMTSHPTLARCMEVSGKSLRTVQRWCRWLETRDLLFVLEEGTTPRFRPAILRRGDERNLAREWRLTIPAHPSVTPVGSFFPTPLRGRAEEPLFGPSLRSGLPSRPAGTPGRDRLAGARVRARPKTAPTGQGATRAAMLSAAEWLRRESLTLRRISTRMLRHLLRPFWQRAWTVSDVLHALDFLPSGEPHASTDRVRDPAAWVRWRLSHWLMTDQSPGPSRSQELAAQGAKLRAEQAARQREHTLAAERAAAVDVARRAAELRAIARDALKAAAPRSRASCAAHLPWCP